MNTLFKKTTSYILFAVALCVFTTMMTVPAEARTLTEAQVKSIELLLKSYGVDEGTLATVSSVLLRDGDYSYSAPAEEYAAIPATTNIANMTASGNCLSLVNNLYLNLTDSSTNKEVSKLQSFLNMTPTGIFDLETEQKVQAWQARNNIVSAGTSDTTGYGYVGPRTRAALAACTYTTKSATTQTPGTVASVNTPVAPQTIVPSVVVSAFPCTIRNTSCDVSFAYSTQNTPGTTVDILVQRPDGTTSGTFYANRPTLGVLSIPVFSPGTYTIHIYAGGQNFIASSLLRTSTVSITRAPLSESGTYSGGEGAGANGEGMGGDPGGQAGGNNGGAMEGGPGNGGPGNR